MFYYAKIAAPLSNKEKKKIDRVDTLTDNIGKLRAKYKADLDKGDKNTSDYLCALAVAIMDTIYERVGNEDSAEDGHYGVTVFQKRHVKVKGQQVTFNYTGKSGVDHKKTLSDKRIADALSKILKDLPDEDSFIFDCDPDDGEDTVCVRASHVNDYLKPFGVTAKDIRGYHANTLMDEALKGFKKPLSEDLTKDERKAQRKSEFEKALKQVAKDIGHEEATLRTHYLLPHVEKTYLES